MNYPLWEKTNKTLFSSVFNVAPGNVCLLFANDLAAWKIRAEASESKVPQLVCVRRVLHEFDASSAKKKDSTCGWIFDIGEVKANKIADALVRTCGVPWQLSMCKNIGIIGVPGSYRLELNDSTAIGVAQVYAELYTASDFPQQVADLFFK